MSANFPVEAVYFDTNALISAGWPQPSSQLLEILSQAERLKVPPALPATVQFELEEHWLRELHEKFTAVQNSLENLNRKAARAIKPSKLNPLPSRDALLQEITRNLADVSCRFEVVPQTAKPVANFISMAVNREATFKEHGHGFQDAVILCSILEHMVSKGRHHALLVTHDPAFKTTNAAAFVRQYGVTLTVMKDLDELGAWLTKQFNERIQAYLEEEKRLMVDAVDAKKAVLTQHLKDRLSVSQSDLPIYGTLKRITDLQIVSIIDAHRSHPLFETKTQEEGTEQLSIDAKVRLEVEEEQYQPTSSPTFKIGGKSVSEPISSDSDFSALRSLLGLRSGFRECDVIITIDAEARRTKTGFENLVFGWARVKKGDLRTLGALFGP